MIALARLLLSALLGVLVAAIPGTRTIDHHIAIGHASVLRLQIESGYARLTADSPGGNVLVRALIGGSSVVPRVQTAQVGNAVVVTLTGFHVPALPFVQSGAVAYEIHYPARVQLEVRAFNGGIAVESPHARVAVQSSAGNVAVTKALGEVDLATDAGDISVTLASGWNASEARLQSANGNLRLVVPSDLRAAVSATTADGTVRNEVAPTRSPHLPLVWLYTRRGNVTITASSP